MSHTYTFNCDKAVSGRSVYTFKPEKTVVFTAEMVRKPFTYAPIFNTILHWNQFVKEE
jgi:hypothetical protein